MTALIRLLLWGEKFLFVWPGKVDYVLSVRVWVGFEPELGSKKNMANKFKNSVFTAFYKLNLPPINANASTGHS